MHRHGALDDSSESNTHAFAVTAFQQRDCPA
jgi:hypothetical protein